MDDRHVDKIVRDSTEANKEVKIIMQRIYREIFMSVTEEILRDSFIIVMKLMR